MIAQRVQAYARKQPDTRAVTDRASPHGPIRHWTFGDLMAGMSQTAAAFDSRLRDGEPVGIVMTSTFESVVQLLAADMSGHPAVLLPTSLTPEETTTLLSDACIRSVYGPEGRTWTGRKPIAEFADTFIFQLTSGSLGRSRLAARTRNGVTAEIQAVSERLNLSKDATSPTDGVLCTSSIAHSYGLIGGLLAPLRAGMRVILASTPADARDMVAGCLPTIVVGLASTYRTLLEAGTDTLPAVDVAMEAVRFPLSAGAPFPRNLFDACLARWGTPIRQDYGTTETGTISIDTADRVDPGSVGVPLPHLRVRIATPRNLPLEPGEVGEIQIWPREETYSYLSEGKLALSQDEQGWYGTGDAGAIDSAGQLRVGRRLRPPILVHGLAVRPERIERTLQLLPGVREAVAVPAPGRDSASAIKAVIVAPHVPIDTIQRWCENNLLPEEQPEFIEFRDQLPKSPAGKILHKYML